VHGIVVENVALQYGACAIGSNVESGYVVTSLQLRQDRLAQKTGGPCQ
jgi:hypothetical protein